MRMDFQIRSHRRKRAAAALREDRPLRVAGLLALVHRFEGLLQSGAVKDYAELARLGHVSRARITQIMNLLDLAVPIQEHLLGGLPTIITEKHLRHIRREVRWDCQMALLRQPPPPTAERSGRS